MVGGDQCVQGKGLQAVYVSVCQLYPTLLTLGTLERSQLLQWHHYEKWGLAADRWRHDMSKYSEELDVADTDGWLIPLDISDLVRQLVSSRWLLSHKVT